MKNDSIFNEKTFPGKDTKMNRIFRHPLFIIILCYSVLFGVSGCSGTPDFMKSKYNKAVDDSIEYKVTDREVLEFTNHLRHML